MAATTDIDRSQREPALEAGAAASLGALFAACPSLVADLAEAGQAHTT